MKFQLIAAVDLLNKGLELNEPHFQLGQDGMLVGSINNQDTKTMVEIQDAAAEQPEEELEEMGEISCEISPISISETITETEIKHKKGGRPPKKKTP